MVVHANAVERLMLIQGLFVSALPVMMAIGMLFGLWWNKDKPRGMGM